MERKEKKMSNELTIDTTQPPAGTNNIHLEQNITVIKRYKNRKLYDTNQSCYVTLTDIKDLIKQGHEIIVVDNSTKENITSLTLLQLFFEVQKKKLINGEVDAMTMNSLVEAIRVM